METRWLVGTRKGLFRVTVSDDKADFELLAFAGEPVTAVLSREEGRDLMVALDLGHFGPKLWRSRDGGTNFEELALPTYPEKPADFEDVNPNTQKPREWKLGMIWTLEAGGPGRPRRIWAGTLPGGLFLSEDDGAHFDLVRSLWDLPERPQWFGGGYEEAGLHSILVDPRDPDRVLVGISCGGVWESTDAGGHFASRCKGMSASYMPPERAEDPSAQDPHRLARSPTNPDLIWCQHHDGLFVSEDGAQSWRRLEDVTPSPFGFGVVGDVAVPGQAFVLPAVKDMMRIPADGRVVVNRLEDAGRRVTTLSEGLPGPHAYDLFFRHALDTHPADGRLLFGSTTGGLYTGYGDDRPFRLLNAHLPPVHCVRPIV